MANHFQNIIERHLDAKAEADLEFREKYLNPERNIEQCIEYIYAVVQESGRHGFADEEVYAMAEEYYTLPTVDIKDVGECSVIVNQRIELTEEEKEAARQRAINELVEAEKRKHKPPKPTTKPAPKQEQETAPTLQQGALF